MTDLRKIETYTFDKVVIKYSFLGEGSDVSLPSQQAELLFGNQRITLFPTDCGGVDLSRLSDAEKSLLGKIKEILPAKEMLRKMSFTSYCFLNSIVQLNPNIPLLPVF
jgi:hypothetical protein